MRARPRRPATAAATAARKVAEKHARFAAEYVVDFDGAQAAERAGYSARRAKQTAYELLQFADVQAEIRRLQAARAARVEVTQDYVLRTLTEVVERCMERAPVMTRVDGAAVQATDDDGRHVWRFDAKNAATALGLLGKHLGLFVDRTEVTGKDGAAVPVQVWQIGANTIPLGG